MPDTVFAALIVLGGSLVAQFAYVLATALAGLPFFKIDKMSVGTGPQLIAFKIGDAEFRIAAFIFTGYVRFKDDPYDATPESEDPSPNSFAGGPWWQKLLIVLAGPTAMIGVAAIVLGPAAIDVAASSFVAIGDMVQHPFAPIEITGVLVPIAREHGVIVAMATVAAFAGGLQFLPLSYVSGGMAILCLAQAFHGQALPLKLQEKLHYLSFAANMVLFLLALVGIAL